MCTNSIFPLISSGGKEDATADGHSYHAYTYMIAFTCFLTVTLLSCMNCCTFNNVSRSIVDDMYLVKVAVKQPAHAISYLLTSCCIVENIAAMSH